MSIPKFSLNNKISFSVSSFIEINNFIDQLTLKDGADLHSCIYLELHPELFLPIITFTKSWGILIQLPEITSFTGSAQVKEETKMSIYSSLQTYILDSSFFSHILNSCILVGLGETPQLLKDGSELCIRLYGREWPELLCLITDFGNPHQGFNSFGKVDNYINGQPLFHGRTEPGIHTYVRIFCFLFFITDMVYHIVFSFDQTFEVSHFIIP